MPSDLAARCRADLPQITPPKHFARKCFFFYSTDEGEGFVGRKWLGCICPTCSQDRFEECANQEAFWVDGMDHNAPSVLKLQVQHRSGPSQAEYIHKSLKVSMPSPHAA